MITVSEQDFKKMVDELLNEEDVKFITLCQIAETNLRGYVKRWCMRDTVIGKRADELVQDIMQNIHVRLIKSVVPFFLLKDGVDGKVNYDHEGFGGWLFRVAHRVTIDYLKLEKKKATDAYEVDGEEKKDGDSENYHRKKTDIDTESDPADIYDEKIKNESVRELVRECFDIVIDSKIAVYKILTWLALSLVMLNLDETKIKSTDAVVEQLKNKTLFQMRDFIYAYDQKLTWLDLSEEQKKKIDNALNAPYNKKDDESTDSQSVEKLTELQSSDGKGEVGNRPQTWGDVKYGSFFMSKGGKASVSDWVNKINKTIKRRVAYETLN